MQRPCRALLVYPRFLADTFWSFARACALLDVKYPTIPLGLITVAAMLPQAWDIRLVDRNIEDLSEDDLAWADLIMSGGMIVQQPDVLAVIDIAHAHGKPIVVGGPDATSSPHVYGAADFLVLGEAEDILKTFLAAWEAGERTGVFTAEKYQVDMTTSPMPRYDLLKLGNYLYAGVQFSRGCPFTCEFCDIIELYGRTPRTKAAPQVLAELDRLHALGHRGHVDFVDDNLIGNKKALKLFLPELIAWQQARDYPFEFSTEASINLADDDDLLESLKQANFFAVFVGIESPDPKTLAHAKKKQNTRRNIAESIHKLYRAGMWVTAGFIVGFDTETASVADAMVELIDEAAIPVCMISPLTVVPNTGLARRLTREGRLHQGYEVMPAGFGDQCTLGLNFSPLRPPQEILDDFRRIIARIYEPRAYAARLNRLMAMLDCSGRRHKPARGDVRFKYGATQTVQRVVNAVPEASEPFWEVFWTCARANPHAVRSLLMLMALYAHLRPFSLYVGAQIARRIASLDETSSRNPALPDVAARLSAAEAHGLPQNQAFPAA